MINKLMLLLLAISSFAQVNRLDLSLTTSRIANAGTTGTTANKLAKLTGAPSTAVIAAAGDVSGILGIVVDGAGTTGYASITRIGKASCVFDGATTAGHYVQQSASVAGDCTDAGALCSVGQVVGKVLSTNGGGGTYQVELGTFCPLPQTLASATGKWFKSYDAATGLFTQTQPATSDLSDISAAGSVAGQLLIYNNTAHKYVPATITAGSNITVTNADGSVTVASTGGGGGALTLLEQHTASTSASLDFTTAITSTYDEYVIELLNLIPATNAQNLIMLASTNGGSTYDSTAGNYRYAYDLRFSTSASSFGGFSATAGSLIPTAGIYNGAGSFGISGTIHLYNPLQSTMTKTVNFHLNNVDNNHTADVEYIVGSGMYSVSGSSVNALRFLFASGNITSGIVRVYGVSH